MKDSSVRRRKLTSDVVWVITVTFKFWGEWFGAVKLARDWFELVVRPYVRKMSPDAFINCVSCLAHVLSVADVAGD